MAQPKPKPNGPGESGERTRLLGDRLTTHHLPNNFSLDHSGPTLLQSTKRLFLSSWMNLLLVAVPLSFISHFLGWGSTADFIISFIAVIPLAALLGDATEQVSIRLGQTLGGLLNATFGNAVEAIVGIIALLNNQLRLVQTSLLGSILSNVLLVLGCSFLASVVRSREATFQQTAAQASTSILTLATAGLLLPAAYAYGKTLTPEVTHEGVLFISRGTAVILLVVYIFYLYFQLKTHAYLFEAEQTDEEEEPEMGIVYACVALAAVTVITSFVADYLVGSIDEFADRFGIPQSFIGLILLPIVGNAAEHVTSVWMAAKGKMELTIGVSVGSSIQIAVGVIPLLVLIAWAIGRELTLVFATYETTSLFVSTLLVNLLLQDGKTHWLEGLCLIALYLIVALLSWVS